MAGLSSNVGTKTSLFANVGFATGSDFSASYSRNFKASFVTGLTVPGANPRQVAASCGSDIGCIWETAHYKQLSDVQLLKQYSEQLLDSRKKLGKSVCEVYRQERNIILSPCAARIQGVSYV